MCDSCSQIRQAASGGRPERNGAVLFELLDGDREPPAVPLLLENGCQMKVAADGAALGAFGLADCSPSAGFAAGLETTLIEHEASPGGSSGDNRKLRSASKRCIVETVAKGSETHVAATSFGSGT